MRGKVLYAGGFREAVRITPAYAGKRACEESQRVCAEGSPPPMRGKGNLHWSDQGPGRITPAYAGKRCSQESKNYGYRDHPRLCGEKENSIHTFFSPIGSPPPMRGKAPVW